MKFGLMFANVGPFMFPDSLARLEKTAEDVGIESMWTVEHVVIPVGYRSEYPYSGSGKMPGDESLPLPDPLLPLAFVAAVTTKIRLATGVMILPQRHPAYVAKQVATLDLLSNGRTILGVGSGWLAEEFATVGVPFHERGARTNEAIRAIRSLWQDGAQPFDGKFYKWAAVESNPKPVQKPGPPIVIGGHSEAAAKRAARLGDGFFPAKGLAELLPVLRAECEKVGRKPESIELTTGAGKTDVDVARRYEDMGVARLTVNPAGFDEESVRAGLLEFGDKVIAKV